MIDKEIKLSLILPSLNVADYIKETLDSARSQMLKEIEIICIDAGSTDGTLAIIEDAVRDDLRVRLIHSDIRSYGYQVNLGIEAAKGKYVAVLETDDFVDPDMYRKLYDVAEENGADYAKADYDAFFSQDDGSYYFFPRHSFSDKGMYEKVIRPRDYGTIGRDDWYLWQGIYSKQFLKKNNIRFNETPGAAFQDIGFLFWSGAYAEKAVYLRDIFYHYRIDRETASSNLGRNLKFAYAEYLAITDGLSRLGQVDDKAYHLLYSRMAKSFVSSYSRIDESDSSREERKNIYEWFCGRIKQALEEGHLTEDEILIGHRDRLRRLIESEDAYFSGYSEKEIDSFIDTHDRFAIFGCGDFGFKAYNRLRSKGKTILSFYDNNTMLWGKTFNGIQINDPTKVRALPVESVVLIANEAYHNEIKLQLIELGLEESRLLVYR